MCAVKDSVPVRVKSYYISCACSTHKCKTPCCVLWFAQSPLYFRNNCSFWHELRVAESSACLTHPFRFSTPTRTLGRTRNDCIRKAINLNKEKAE